MYKIYTNKPGIPSGCIHKLLLIVRLTTVILFATFIQVSASTYAQKISLTGKNSPLNKILNEISNQSGYDFIYTDGVLKAAKPVTVRLSGVSFLDALDQVLQGQPLEYTINKNTVVIKEKPTSILAWIGMDFPDLINIGGVVRGADGNVLPGATITIKGSRRRFVTGQRGEFLISGLEENSTLLITYIGYEPMEIKVNRGLRFLELNLSLATNTIDDVVITGTGIVRKKDSFTGSASTFTGLELKAVGNKNLLESLKSLDPSFIKVENNLQGSNPNTMPKFEVRGRTSISTSDLNNQFNADPNQPLFILDGFESTLQQIYDLDMNRVASVTILKDAASTALYGAKASNGVIVVETKRPVPGQLQISYTGDFSMDLPDLSSYNLMNAAEKLEYERLSGGIYRGVQFPWIGEEKYNSRLAEVQRGVDTYWLNEPVRIGITNRHSLQLGGGNSDFMFNAGASYGNQGGAMKGSGRETFGGNMNLSYRKGRINVNNMLSVSGSKATESPYGSFENFARANPFFRKELEDGTIPKYLDPVYDMTAINPLYNATLESINQNKIFSFFNNTQAILTISDSFRLQGGLQLSKGNNVTTLFVPPDNSQFDNVELHQKGLYTSGKTDNSAYSANLMLTYAKVIGKHQLNANVRGDVQRTAADMTGFSATGFPYGTNGNPAFAYGYVPFSVPASAVTEARSVGFLASANYGFDQRFLLDVVYRLDGASVFGSDHLFKPFVSGGLGWNIHREKFLRNVRWINLLKIRGDIGYTGNENLGQFSSVSTYQFQAGNNNNFGQGLSMASLGNPSLDWQKTLQDSYGLDFAFANNRISGYVEYYHKNTDPLSVAAAGTLPSSAGVNSNYVLNVGHLTTKGWLLNLKVSPVYNVEKRIIWSLGITGSNYTSEYGGLGNTLATLNEEQRQSRGLSRFYDGYSPDDIWAVVSRGVDPATGREIFQKKDGSLTFTYDPNDIVRVGNLRPKMEGVINTSLSYKDFTFSAMLRYRVKGSVFNSALFNKVENIDGGTQIYNLDKRALYNRWQKPGDVTQFIGIGEYAGSPMSSRFVEEDTHFIGESFNIGWRSFAGWVRKLKVQSLGISFYANDIFRLEKIQTERGISYPYARTASFSVNATF
ncbi:SusC/RagA family TonB-linked outer membrane protein [Pedobacter sp. BAL39]|uniref:SusC/RagA family TonB-linked outer membrane protein n=1 Tax=Pedobacter sp. BAL39 TaxID=391596 RepID=UPI0018DD9538|nr:SusC/RagA family TonB-linked outer membrane protein [Pedobacter sp. BAL39]